MGVAGPWQEVLLCHRPLKPCLPGLPRRSGEAIFSGLGIGASLGIVIREGASTGGCDIPPLILHKKTGISVSGILSGMDYGILLLQAFSNPPEKILYGFLVILLYSLTMDRILLSGAQKTEVRIVSRHADEIRKEILTEVDRGVTVLAGAGGFTGEEETLLLSVISNRELPAVEKIIRAVDPEAFVVISRVAEVSGRGLNRMKIDRNKVLAAFESYAKEYNLEDVKIRLKYDHTFRVAENAERIAGSLSLSPEDTDLAWLLGILHDIGRFEQLRRFGTFQDRVSVNHAALSADILFHEGLIERFREDRSEDALIEKAVRLHNVFRLPVLTWREYTFCAILRDADKADILRVRTSTESTRRPASTSSWATSPSSSAWCTRRRSGSRKSRDIWKNSSPLRAATRTPGRR